MNLFYLISLLVIIDLQDQFKFLYLTAFIQFSSYSLFHVNYFFVSGLNYFFRSSFILNIIGICVYLFYFELHFIYELYLFIMIIAFLCSVPVFFLYINYRKTLENNKNKKKLHITFKFLTKLTIFIIFLYEYNLFSFLVFFLWIVGQIIEYKRNNISNKFGLSDKEKKQTRSFKSITELELEKLNEYLCENKSSVFKSPTKKR